MNMHVCVEFDSKRLSRSSFPPFVLVFIVLISFFVLSLRHRRA